MISKSLFSNLLKEDLKRRLWTIALSVLLFFIALPIITTLSIGGENSYRTWEIIQDQLTRIVAANNLFIILITIAGGVVCGLSSFFYLHSKKKVDMYHSIPVRREKLFAVNYLNGVLIYAVPYIFNIILTLLIIQINGYMTLDLLQIALISMGINLLFYVLIYTLAIIAVMLTGNLVIGIFGTGVFLSYGPLLMLVKEVYFSEFFKHYSDMFSDWNIITFLSPLGSYFKMANVNFGYSYRAYGFSLQTGMGLSVVKTVIITLLLIAFALFLFKKRASEAAGKAMSFSISRPIIKFLLVVPIALLGGIIFRQVSDSRDSVGWFIFGLIFIFLIISAIIEIMFQFDIRAAFYGKKHLLFCALVVSFIACTFQLDLFKYDSYIPDKAKIDYMGISISGLGSNGSYVNLDGVNDRRNYINSMDYHLNCVKLKDFEAAYTLAKIGIEKETAFMDSNKNTYDIRVKYVLKNGKEVTRKYLLASNENIDLLSSIYDNKEYKEVHYQIYDFNTNDIEGISCESQKSSKDLTLNQEEIKEFLNIYKDELSKLKLEDFNDIQIIAGINFRIKNYQYASYDIYDSFDNTIAFLENHGFNDFLYIKADNVKSVEVSYYNPDMEKEVKSYDAANNTRIYTDKQEIEEILQNAISQDIYWNNYSFLDKEEYFDLFLTTNIDTFGNTRGGHYYFKKGSVPDFIKDDLGYKE